MKKFKKSLAVVLTLAMVVASMTGCKKDKVENVDTKDTDTTVVTPGAESTPVPEKVVVQDVTLKVWASEEEQEVMTANCEAFAVAHPEYNLTFEYAVIGNAEACDELKKDLEIAADVFVYPSAAIPELKAAGILYPITIEDAEVVKQSNGAGAITACTSDDLLYGVPQSPNSWFMYYNKSLFTQDDIKSVEAMLAKDLGDGVSNFSCKISDSWFMSAYFYALGGTLYGTDGTDPTSCSWNDANGLKVGNYLINLSKNIKYVEDIDGIASSLFKEGKLGAVCSGTWSAVDFKAALGDNYGATVLPTINVEGTDYQLSNFADFRAFGVKSNTAYPIPAQQLACFLGNEQSQLATYVDQGIAPSVSSLAQNEIVAADLAVTALLQQSNYSTPQPSTPQLSEYWNPAIAFGTGIINGDITEANLQESLDAMVKSFTTKLVE